MSVYDRGEVDSDTFVSQVGTLNGNPVACAAGLATLEVLRGDPDAYRRVQAAGAALRNAMTELCAENGIPVQSCGEDAVFDYCFSGQPVNNYRDLLSGDGATMSRLNAGLLEHGVLKGGQKYYPSAVHTEEDVERTIEAYRQIVPTLQG
jgi:glutamate-1-semialdehyde 2,1-aminomutase